MGYAKDKGVLLVVAAGNDGVNTDTEPSYPASYGDGNILAVAATTADDTLADFSNYGEKSVDVAAPGDQIRSTYLGSSYKYLSGTSMAAPMVAGAAALPGRPTRTRPTPSCAPRCARRSTRRPP